MSKRILSKRILSKRILSKRILVVEDQSDNRQSI